MTYFNQKFYKKSFLLEFEDSTKDVSSIAFSLPPQSEEFTFPQRIGETKTFGGAVIEDYGNDSFKISLSGTTANSQIRIIYKNKSVSTVTGEEELFEVKKLIETNGKTNKLGKKVHLYSLDNGKSQNNKYWRVVVNEFAIKRSKENPLAYTYSLSCTGIPEEKKKYGAFGLFSKFQDAVDKSVSAIKKGSEVLESGLYYYRTGLDLIEILKDSVEKYEDAFMSYVSAINGYTDSTTDYVTETLSLGKTVVKSGKRVSLGAATDIVESAYQLHLAGKDLYTYIGTIDANSISSDFITSFNMTAEDIVNTWKLCGADIESSCDKIYADTKLQQTSLDYMVIPGDSGEDDKVIQVYGLYFYTATDTDTWDSLASTLLGDSTYAAALALYNGKDSGSVLEAGAKISIPNLSQKDGNSGVNNVQ